MQQIDLAIVIPTLNEEKYIGILLDSIANQTVSPKEVVIVDAQSKDKTKKVIEKRFSKLPQLKFTQIPKYTISRQRNLGASLTSASIILFLDADMKLEEKDTLETYFREVKNKEPDIAVSTNLPLSTSWKDKVIFMNMNMLVKAARPFWPWAPGMNICVKRSSFERIKGFDEEVRVAEDIDLVQRMVKIGGSFEFLEEPKIYTSVRRFIKEGRRQFLWKMVKNFVEVNRKGFREADIEYEFGKFGKLPKEKNMLEKIIKSIEKQRFTEAIVKITKKIL